MAGNILYIVGFKKCFIIKIVLLFLLFFSVPIITAENNNKKIDLLKVNYYSQVKHSVSSKWQIPKNVPIKAHAVVEIVIRKNGEITNFNIIQKSGFKDFDDSMKEAVSNTILAPLPEVFEEKEIKVRLNFRVLI